MTLADAARAIGAKLNAASDAKIRGISIDTRTLQRGELFVALTGSRDGHEFLDDALSRGACGALVRGDLVAPAELAALRVPDPLRALGDLANFQRKRLTSRVIAITGSAGKTSTKDFTAAVLGSRFRVAASPASFNNEIGVPLTILSADLQTEAIVAEVGARGIGHIRSLMPMLDPDVGVVTNVGAAHIGMFGSIEAIGKAKSEIIEGLHSGGCAVLNADDEITSKMIVPDGVDLLTFGATQRASVSAMNVTMDARARPRFTLVTPQGKSEVSLTVSGEHMVSNALAAAAIGYRFGITVEEIAEQLATARTSAHRMAVIESPRGWTVIDDTYNASPASVVAALKALKTISSGRRTWAVLGHMAELGDSASEQHDLIGRLVVRLGIGKLVTIGSLAQALHEAARLEGMSTDDAVFVPDESRAIEVLLARIEPGDVVLVKAARVAALERIVEAVT